MSNETIEKAYCEECGSEDDVCGFCLRCAEHEDDCAWASEPDYVPPRKERER